MYLRRVSLCVVISQFKLSRLLILSSDLDMYKNQSFRLSLHVQSVPGKIVHWSNTYVCKLGSWDPIKVL